MKIELIKETKIDGDVLYFTRVDGRFVSNSLALDYDKARLLFSNITTNKGKVVLEEVLETIEI